MINPFRKSHLRLVSSAGSNKEEIDRSFNESDGRLTLWMVSESAVLRNESFLLFLASEKIKYLFDLRIAPRLDFIAPTRVLAFKRLAELNVSYVDVTGALDVGFELQFGLMPEEWAKSVGKRICNMVDSETSCAFIFDNDDVLRRSRNVLPNVIGNMCRDRKVSIQLFSEMSSDLIAL